ncbi:MAG: hypothetical protein Q8L86_18210 [Vicinamibacterales bacterium]|nr:hypothetical protein [Vicinamibacterales bacterium]
MTESQNLKAIFKEAADIAAQVPESLRQVAFQRALDALLNVAPPPARRAAEDERTNERQNSGNTGPRQQERGSHSASVTALLEMLDRTELAGLLRGRKVLDRSLLLLRAAQHHDIDALTAADIAHVLAKKFREPTAASAVRMALDRSPSYTDRRPNGGTFFYSLMAPGEAYLASLADPQVKPARPSSSQLRRRRAKPKGATKSASSPRAAVPSSSKQRRKRSATAGRPGPKAALESLLTEGFFSEPRIMSEILTYLQVEKTFAYKTSDMTATLQRLVRQGHLTRSRNAEEQFQYTAK